MNHDSTNQKKTKPVHRKRKARPPNLSEQERRQILDLRQQRYGTREIARRVGRDRKTVHRVLDEEGFLDLPSPQRDTSKLDPFRELIQGKVKDQLTITRILHEIRAVGCSGGRTILAQYIRTIRAPLAPSRPVKRRFETRQGD